MESGDKAGRKFVAQFQCMHACPLQPTCGPTLSDVRLELHSQRLFGLGLFYSGGAEGGRQGPWPPTKKNLPNTLH